MILLEAHLLICQIYFGDLLMIVSSFGWGLCWYKLKGCHFWNLWKCTHLDLQTVFRRMSNSKALDQVTSCSNLFVGENAGPSPSPLRKTGILPEIWGTVPRSSAVEAMFLGLITAANRWFGAMRRAPVFSRLSPPDTESAELRKPRVFF